eukprot:scaffold57963_cov75-Phaeocystis_antarctica.AAC.1
MSERRRDTIKSDQNRILCTTSAFACGCKCGGLCWAESPLDTCTRSGSQGARTPVHEGPPASYTPWMGRPKFGSLCAGARGGRPIPALAAGAGAGAGAPTPVQ